MADPWALTAQSNIAANAQSTQAILAGGQMFQSGLFGGIRTGAGVMQQNRQLDQRDQQMAMQEREVQMREQAAANRRILDEQLIRKGQIEAESLQGEILLRQQLNGLKLQTAQTDLEYRKLQKKIQEDFGESNAMVQLRQASDNMVFYRGKKPFGFDIRGSKVVEVELQPDDPRVMRMQQRQRMEQAQTALMEARATGVASQGQPQQSGISSSMVVAMQRRLGEIDKAFLYPSQLGTKETAFLETEQKEKLKKGESLYVGPPGQQEALENQRNQIMSALQRAYVGVSGQQMGAEPMPGQAPQQAGGWMPVTEDMVTQVGYILGVGNVDREVIKAKLQAAAMWYADSEYSPQEAMQNLLDNMRANPEAALDWFRK